MDQIHFTYKLAFIILIIVVAVLLLDIYFQKAFNTPTTSLTTSSAPSTIITTVQNSSLNPTVLFLSANVVTFKNNTCNEFIDVKLAYQYANQSLKYVPFYGFTYKINYTGGGSIQSGGYTNITGEDLISLNEGAPAIDCSSQVIVACSVNHVCNTTIIK